MFVPPTDSALSVSFRIGGAPFDQHPAFARLLEHAVTDPGLVSAAYHAFHSYSVGNQLLALDQCLTRGIPPGPIATYGGWKSLGRQVRKGEKAIVLCMPITCKRSREREDGS